MMTCVDTSPTSPPKNSYNTATWAQTSLQTDTTGTKYTYLYIYIYQKRRAYIYSVYVYIYIWMTLLHKANVALITHCLCLCLWLKNSYTHPQTSNHIPNSSNSRSLRGSNLWPLSTTFAKHSASNFKATNLTSHESKSSHICIHCGYAMAT